MDQLCKHSTLISDKTGIIWKLFLPNLISVSFHSLIYQTWSQFHFTLYFTKPDLSFISLFILPNLISVSFHSLFYQTWSQFHFTLYFLEKKTSLFQIWRIEIFFESHSIYFLQCNAPGPDSSIPMLKYIFRKI